MISLHKAIKKDYPNTRIKDIPEAVYREYADRHKAAVKVLQVQKRVLPKPALRIKQPARPHKVKQYPELTDKHRSYLMRANSKGLKFTLTAEQFNGLLELPCVYCGSDNANGVDRLDSNYGYTLDNSVPCCTHCNMMKYTYSKESFIRQVERIYQHLHRD